MENHDQNTKNGSYPTTSGKRSKTDQRWTLLFIGDHGKTITFKRFKGIVLLTGLVLVVSVAITLGLLYFSINVHQTKSVLETELQDLKDQVKALRYEKDVLMTKLVLAESRTKREPADTRTEAVEPGPAPEKEVEPETPPQSVQIARTAENPPVKEVAQPRPDQPGSADELSVDIEDFEAIPATDENLLRIQFKIKNTTPKSRRVSGHTIVVLRPDSAGGDRSLTIPPMSLSNGKPTGRRRGYSFGINHFKTMRLKTNLPKSPEIYRSATVYVFTRQGDLLLEKNFPVSLPAATSTPPTVQTTSESSAPTTPPAAVPPATASPTEPAASGSPRPSTDELMKTLKDPATQ